MKLFRYCSAARPQPHHQRQIVVRHRRRAHRRGNWLPARAHQINLRARRAAITRQVEVPARVRLHRCAQRSRRRSISTRPRLVQLHRHPRHRLLPAHHDPLRRRRNGRDRLAGARNNPTAAPAQNTRRKHRPRTGADPQPNPPPHGLTPAPLAAPVASGATGAAAPRIRVTVFAVLLGTHTLPEISIAIPAGVLPGPE